LLVKADKLAHLSDEKLDLVILTPLGDGTWRVSCTPSGVNGCKQKHETSGIPDNTKFSTLEEAEAWVKTMSEKYPNPDGYVAICNDVGYDYEKGAFVKE